MVTPSLPVRIAVLFFIAAAAELVVAVVLVAVVLTVVSVEAAFIDASPTDRLATAGVLQVLALLALVAPIARTSRC